MAKKTRLLGKKSIKNKIIEYTIMAREENYVRWVYARERIGKFR